MKIEELKKKVKVFAAQFDRNDLPVLLLPIAIGLLSYGASIYHPGAGYLIAGAVILLYFKPLAKWWK